MTFTPQCGLHPGETTISYTVTDPEGLTDTATVTVTVTERTGGRDGIVRGTEGDDVINGGYVDPTDGDRVDATDALILGDGPNDDRIEAGGGNDSAYGGLWARHHQWRHRQ